MATAGVLPASQEALKEVVEPLAQPSTQQLLQPVQHQVLEVSSSDDEDSAAPPAAKRLKPDPACFFQPVEAPSLGPPTLLAAFGLLHVDADRPEANRCVLD